MHFLNPIIVAKLSSSAYTNAKKRPNIPTRYLNEKSWFYFYNQLTHDIVYPKYQSSK